MNTFIIILALLIVIWRIWWCIQNPDKFLEGLKNSLKLAFFAVIIFLIIVVIGFAIGSLIS